MVALDCIEWQGQTLGPILHSGPMPQKLTVSSQLELTYVTGHTNTRSHLSKFATFKVRKVHMWRTCCMLSLLPVSGTRLLKHLYFRSDWAARRVFVLLFCP